MESPYEKDLLWTGSDDGLLHVSRDGGKNWDNVTPKQAPKWMMWNSLDADPFRKGAAYAVGTRYKSDDFTPYIYKTEDYGKSWQLITGGIDKMHFTRVVRADPKRPGLLYAGTEYGMYISFDDGASWKRFQLNLPLVPVTDLTIKENDLVVATQGRSFYVLDDLTVLQQLSPAISSKKLHVFDVTPAYRMPGNPFSQNFGTPRNAGINPPAGVTVYYYASDITDTTKAVISILNKDKKLVKSFSTDAKENNLKTDISKGMNRFVWDLRYPEAERIEGMILWNGVPSGIIAPPGNYFVRVKAGMDSSEVPFTIRADPNYRVSQQEYDAQFAFLDEMRTKFNETQKAIRDLRSLRTQINSFITLQGKDVPKEVKQAADSINKQLTSIEETLYQTKSKSSQDVLNYPIRLNDKLSGVFDAANSGNFAPSKQVREVYNDLAMQINVQLSRLEMIKQKDIPAFNELVRQNSLPVIGLR
jgi:hypothetical protein